MIHWRTLAGENGNTILLPKSLCLFLKHFTRIGCPAVLVVDNALIMSQKTRTTQGQPRLSLSTNWHTMCYAVQGQPNNLFRNTCFIWMLGAKAPSFCCRYNYTLHPTHYTLHRHPSTTNRSSAAFFPINQIIIWPLKTNHLSFPLKIRRRENIHCEKV